MGIGTALTISLTGLRANQAQLDASANNVANANTPGFSRKRIATQQLVAGSSSLGVAPAKVQRELDMQVQRQWRVSVANAEYAAVRAQSLGRLDAAIGGPGQANSLDTLFNEFKAAFETLANSPEDVSARIDAAAGAETLANRLRSLSSDIQTLRRESESAIAVAAQETNDLLQRISLLDKQIISAGSGGGSTAGLEDERDLAIDRLSELVDIRVEEQRYGAVAIFTTSGTLLYDDQPVRLGFSQAGVMKPESLYSSDPAERGVGTLVIETGPGAGLDVFEGGFFRSGAIAAYRELRDETLVQAQAQLDEIAAQMALAISNRTEPGTAVTGPPDGFELDLAGFKAGNTATLTYTDGTGEHTVTFVGQNGTSAVSNRYTADPNDTVVTVDLTGVSTAADLAAAIQAAATTASVPVPVSEVGGKVRFVDAVGVTVNGARASVSNSALKDANPPTDAFDLFIDSQTGEGFTGISGSADAKLGFAARITINPQVKADPALLVLKETSTSVSEAARPNWVISQISQATITFSPDTGIGTRSAPFQGTVAGFLNQFVATQGAQTENAQRISEGQSVVTANLEERYTDSRKVDIDEEMARLIELQAAYQANARIIQAVKEMLDTLMRI